MTSQTLSLNLIPKGICPRLYVSQYDKGQTWLFDIYAGDNPFTIPNGAVVTIQGTKPDGTGFAYTCTKSGNRVEATEKEQMTVLAGDVPAEIRITNSGEVIATLNFIIAVEKAAPSSDIPISETEIPAIIELAEQQVLDAEAWANGTRNGVPIGSSDPAYEKNGKYYADHFVGYITDTQWNQITAILT